MIQNFQDEVCFVLDTMKGMSKPVFFKVLTSWTHMSLFLGNLCFITWTLSIEFAAETNDGYHIILKWKHRMRGSEQAPYVFLKIQPFSPFPAHFLDLTEDRLAWNNNGDDHGKGKKAPDPFWNLCCFIQGGCAAFFVLPRKTNHKISILLTFFASICFL